MARAEESVQLTPETNFSRFLGGRFELKGRGDLHVSGTIETVRVIRKDDNLFLVIKADTTPLRDELGLSLGAITLSLGVSSIYRKRDGTLHATCRHFLYGGQVWLHPRKRLR